MSTPVIIALVVVAAAYVACAVFAFRTYRRPRPTATAPARTEMVDDGTRLMLDAASGWWIEVHEGDAPRALPIGRGRVVLGSSAAAEIRIADPYVSAQHASLRVTPEGELQLTDLDSTNGTYANGERVSRVVIQHGDTARVGRTRLQFVHAGEALVAMA